MLSKLKDSLQKFARLGVADRKSVKELLREIQRVLIQSDVNVKLVFELSKRIEENALDEKIPAGLTRKEHVVNIVYEELTSFLGEKPPELSLGKQKILLLGLFGSGKTTLTAKLAKFYQNKGLSVGVITTDTWRPAAYHQLEQLAKKTKTPFYGEEGEKDPIKILKNGLKKMKGKDVVIIDSAGRSALDDELAKELKDIEKVLKPKEKLLVLSGDIGQAALKQATEFNKLVGLTGVAVTRMDSSAKGGGVLSACHAAEVNVRFISVGEKPDDLEMYDPVRFVGRLLGMGDLEGLLEKAKSAMDPKKTQELLQGEFTLKAFYQQIESTKKMGSLQQIMEMIPGMGSLKLPKDMLDVQEEKMHKWKIMMDSMTDEELTKTEDVMDKNRVNRIATGSGTKPEEVRELVRSYKQMKKMMKKFKGGKFMKRGGKMGNLLKGMGLKM